MEQELIMEIIKWLLAGIGAGITMVITYYTSSSIKSFFKRICKIWHSPIKLDRLEDKVIEKIEGLSQDHKDAAIERENNKKESKQDIKELREHLEEKIDKNHRQIMNHLLGDKE